VAVEPAAYPDAPRVAFPAERSIGHHLAMEVQEFVAAGLAIGIVDGPLAGRNRHAVMIVAVEERSMSWMDQEQEYR